VYPGTKQEYFACAGPSDKDEPQLSKQARLADHVYVHAGSTVASYIVFVTITYSIRLLLFILWSLHLFLLADMDHNMIQRLMETVELINANLDTSPASWRDQLPAIRNTTASFEIADTVPDEERRNWQLPLISVFQRVAFADADNGAVQDLGDWCLRQLVTLLQIYPENVDILTCEFLRRYSHHR
jgi:hypothetical protein